MPGPEEFSETYVTTETLDDECAKWMEELAPYRWRDVEGVEKDAVALIVVDMTKPFLDEGRPMASANGRAILPRVAELIDAFRKAKRPVLWIVQGHHSVEHDRGKRLANWWKTPILEGTDDVEPATGLEIAKGEKVIIKRRYSGFYQTDLELTLRNLEVTQIVIAGVFTHVCPFATAFDAFARDLCVYYPADATATVNRELHLSALKIIAGWCGYVVRTKDIINALS